MDKLIIKGVSLESRLFVGTGKFSSKDIVPKVIEESGTNVVTMALRRVNLDAPKDNILSYIPKNVIYLPNTSGAKNAEEAVRIARLARAMGAGNWVKIEVISDTKYLLPDNLETIRATEILAKEDFIVLPYMLPDLMDARRLVDAGAATVMPLGSPIGSNRGIRTREMTQIIIDEIDVPVIIDAGIGTPAQGAQAMEMGADGILVNTAIATASDPVAMARAFRLAVEAGRMGYKAGIKSNRSEMGTASSPLTGFLWEEQS